MTISNEHQFNERFDVSSLRSVPSEKLPLVVASVSEMSDELRLKVIDQVPGFMAFALEAMSAVQDTFETTIGSISKEQTELQESFGDLRHILSGRLNRDEISEAHAEFVIEKLVELQRMQTQQKTDTNKLVAEQANLTRLAKLGEAAIPILTTVLSTGVQILINRRGSSGYKI